MNSYIRNGALFIFIKANAIDFIMLLFFNTLETNHPTSFFPRRLWGSGFIRFCGVGEVAEHRLPVLCVSTYAHSIQETSHLGMVFGHPSVQITVSQPHPNPKVSSSKLLSTGHIWGYFFFPSASCWGSKKCCDDIPSLSTEIFHIVISPACWATGTPRLCSSHGLHLAEHTGLLCSQRVLSTPFLPGDYGSVLLFFPFPPGLPWEKSRRKWNWSCSVVSDSL